MSESDGIDEAIRGGMRTAITAAGYAGQQIAQAITDRARTAAQASQEEARELRARYDAERAAARAHVAVVDRPEWWETATAEKVARVWETAHAWREQDPDIDRAAQIIEHQVRERHGVDVGQLVEQVRADRVSEVRAAAGRQSEYDRAREWAQQHDPELLAGHDRALMGSDDAREDVRTRERFVETWRARTGATVDGDAARAAARVDELTAGAVLAEPLEGAAARVELERDAEVLYDSAERRQQLAARLDAAGVGAEAKEARLISDASQAVPANEAVVRGKSAPKARRARPQGRQQDKSLSR